MHHRHKSRSLSRDVSESGQSSEYMSDYSRSRSRSPDSVYRLHIADIGEGVKKVDVERIFEEFGGLKEIWMANSPPCFGFAVFKHKSNAIAALKGTDGLMLCGTRIRVTHARPRTRGMGRRYYNPNMRCYECGIPGHFYRDCPELFGYESGKYSRTATHRHPHHYYPRRRNYSSRNDRRYSEDRSPDEDRRRRK